MTREGEPTANTGFHGRLFLTENQKKKIVHNMKVSRAIYNWARKQNLLEYLEWNKVKEEYKKSLEGKNLSEKEKEDLISKFNKENSKNYISSWQSLNKRLTQEVKQDKETWGWLGDYDCLARFNTLFYSYKAAIRSFHDNFGKNKDRIQKEMKKKPNFIPKYPQSYGFPQYQKEIKSYSTCIKVKQLDRENNRIYLPKIGWVKVTPNQPLPYFTFPSENVANPVVSTDGKNFFITFSYYKEPELLETKNSDIIGIDLGLKTLATLSDGTIIENIAKSSKAQKVFGKIKKLQRKLSWLVEHSPAFYNIKDKKAKWKVKTKQSKSLERRILKANIQLNCLKKDFMETNANRIVQKNPKGIIFEDLNVKGMQSNKKLSNSLQQIGISTFKSVIVRHAKKHGIPCKEVSRYFPSSQICSKCGTIHPEMKKLSRRVMRCECGLELDRDLNAAINLAKEWNNNKSKDI